LIGPVPIVSIQEVRSHVRLARCRGVRNPTALGPGPGRHPGGAYRGHSGGAGPREWGFPPIEWRGAQRRGKGDPERADPLVRRRIRLSRRDRLDRSASGRLPVSIRRVRGCPCAGRAAEPAAGSPGDRDARTRGSHRVGSPANPSGDRPARRPHRRGLFRVGGPSRRRGPLELQRPQHRRGGSGRPAHRTRSRDGDDFGGCGQRVDPLRGHGSPGHCTPARHRGGRR